ncbi:bifunctional enoyl-CoA hydratase/phosphate acetyltransferase [Pseudomonas sp. MWU16-30317]|uniref:bifunctional enoyl-CoA hydratase/phosphate acetyltransferase n=1 Tax=Pseudomonas sp. MWU16-30317 TaxID=2878095 RepID=UPI001CFAED4C|nr:bifunctional enoyl-CoA hydratase/phosphate acetyltransferase [Pseudomonas sp. MWU16-30317]
MPATSLASPAVTHTTKTILDTVLESAIILGRRRIAMVYPCDLASLQIAAELQAQGIANIVLVGPLNSLIALSSVHHINLSLFELIDSGPHVSGAAQIACELARSGEVDMLMKGSLHTDDLMRAVVSRTYGLRTGGRVSHAFVLQLPDRLQPLIISDCVVNVAPTLSEKVEILQLALKLARALGIEKPRAAILSFTESILCSVQSTLDAAVIAKMAERGQIEDALVDGPLAFDNAVSATSAASKGIQSDVAGHADILLVPNLETGNALYKSLIYMAGAKCAGVVLGTRTPIILTSRTDSMESKLYSAALACLLLDPISE